MLIKPSVKPDLNNPQIPPTTRFALPILFVSLGRRN